MGQGAFNITEQLEEIEVKQLNIIKRTPMLILGLRRSNTSLSLRILRDKAQAPLVVLQI